MKKIDALVKRVEFFERLAVYGNRSSFLKALAQEVDPKVAEIISQMDALVRGAGVTDENILGPLGSAKLFHKVDVNAIGNAVRKAMSDPSMITMTNAGKVKQLMDLMAALKVAYRSPEQVEAEQAMQGAPTYEFLQPDKIKAYPPIDKRDQEALARIVMVEGWAFMNPNPDGQLGPQTRKALDAFKDKKGIKSMSDKDALQYATLLAQTDPKYK